MKYYYIKDLSLFAKGEGTHKYYIYKDGEWVLDTERIVSDRLMGYDPYEDDDSPYKIGNTAIMNNIEEISEGEFKGRCTNSEPFNEPLSSIADAGSQDKNSKSD